MTFLGSLCQNGEFLIILGRSRSRLYRRAYSWCHAPELADDLTQDTLSRALRHSTQLKDLNAIDSWLYRILANCWQDYLRNRRDILPFDEDRHLDPATPELINLHQEEIEKLRQAVAALPNRQRQIITLVDLDGCRYAEVAELLELPIGTVMSRLSRARSAVRKKLLIKSGT